MFTENAEFEGLTGVGRVQLTLEPDQRVYTFIGENGVGKTKTLEALFQVFFFSSSLVEKTLDLHRSIYLKFNNFKEIGSPDVNPGQEKSKKTSIYYAKELFKKTKHNLPVLFIGAQSRGIITRKINDARPLENLSSRRESYISSINNKMDKDFGSINMDSSIEQWFVTLAQSSNPYQKKEDNRGFEIETVIKILHEIDSRIDPEFLEISGGGRVSLKIEGQKRELSQLSSGFSSIVKIIQAIVSGYGYFTNETNIQKVKGIILIDEIESHLHLTWQANIIPLLKSIFPNTTFYITTHSSVVLSQLNEGEAYKLYRDSDGIVKTDKIPAPNKAALADILKDVFHIDLNKQKIDNSNADQQQEAKNQLMQLLNQQEEN
ncbi:AAA family ATPase [Erwinia rhapontici]|uniref:AAA family ATPase n=1 Tax=Erwinia rhapontici TaxID=55212 RepID=UPI0021678A9C|nr:ATP-binding protein [Erwinia rhapontici]MCS3605591.1 putative ATP-binding protein involved in virulence [Erwinia rhapontici]